MKYLTEYRDGKLAKQIADQINRLVTKPWRIMEVCGGQTHSIIRNGIDQILPEQVDLIHGPGCPVCVTPLSVVDKALQVASQPNVIFCTFGDMMRVPGSNGNLFRVKSLGGDIRVVYSPLDALAVAKENPEKEVVFFAIGFETTAPANAMSVKLAKEQGLTNYSLLVSHSLVPPAIEAILRSPDCQIDALLAAGHVCAVTGYEIYPEISNRFQVPIVITGFEPLDILEGIRRAIVQLESGTFEVENAYSRVVSREGNEIARKLIEEVFQVTDRSWRGIGNIPGSGWKLVDSYRNYDAECKFQLNQSEASEPTVCRTGEVLLGIIKPTECEAFGTSCTPESPLGATMVSGEGACAAYFHAGRKRAIAIEP